VIPAIPSEANLDGRMVEDDPLSGRRSVAMTTAEAAAFLGLNVESVTRRAQAGTIPVHRSSGRYRFFLDELVDWLRTSRMHDHL
jgi:excisionase family DNA binding protein